MEPHQDHHDEVPLAPWMRLNGRDLRVTSNEPWVCLFVPGREDLMVAKKLAELKIPFFLPLSYERNGNRFRPIWKGYVFCRVNDEGRRLINSKVNPSRILETALQAKLLNELTSTAAFSGMRRFFQPTVGQKIHISGGALWGQHGFVTKADIVGGEKIEVSVELLGGWHHVQVPIKAVDQIFEKTELYPIRLKIEEQAVAVEKKLDLEICEVNRELIEYLDKHPELLYSLPPRKFEFLVADILRGMGYDVTVTPQTRDGGVDIIAVFKSPIGPILTVVECKRYDKHRKIGVEIVERFLFTIREKFRAACGLIATTSSFSQDSLEYGKNYQWQLMLKDFTAIKGWLSNYGRWSEDAESGLWVPRVLENKSIIT